MSTDDFDWNDADHVVVPEQASIAVYLNPKGDVVIRQAGQYHPDEDTWIVFAAQHASRVADALLETAGLADQPHDCKAAAPKDRTAADRQRRYRERNRHASRRNASDSDGTMPLLLLNNASGQTEGA